MWIRILQGCLFYGVMLGVLTLTGCALPGSQQDNGRYERVSQTPPSAGTSLFDVISSVASQFDANWETNAGLEAHKGCRTNAVFDKYHVKYLYDQLKSRFKDLDRVSLVHENGYIFVAVPMSGKLPDSRALTKLGTLLGGNDRVNLFIPGQSPFGHVVDRESLKAVRANLARSGLAKDHVLLLPMDNFGLPSAMASASSQVMPVKICYS